MDNNFDLEKYIESIADNKIWKEMPYPPNEVMPSRGRQNMHLQADSDRAWRLFMENRARELRELETSSHGDSDSGQLEEQVDPGPSTPSLSYTYSSTTDPDIVLTASSLGADTYTFQRSTTSDFSSSVTTLQNTSSNTYTDTGLSPGTYYYRVSATNTEGTSAWTVKTVVVEQYSVTSLDVDFWYDGSDTDSLTVVSTNQVSRWNDLSGNTRHLNDITSVARPTTDTRTLNGLNVIEWTGSSALVNTNFTWDPASHSNGLFIMIVAQLDTTNNQYFWSGTGTTTAGERLDVRRAQGEIRVLGGDGPGTSNLQIGGGSFINAQPCIMTVQVNSNNSAVRYNGSQVVTGNLGSNSFTDFRLGSNGTNTANVDGYFAEVIGFTDLDKVTELEGYLAHKWALTGNLPSNHPYKSSAPTLSS
jgi:hypothetical protein